GPLQARPPRHRLPRRRAAPGGRDPGRVARAGRRGALRREGARSERDGPLLQDPRVEGRPPRTARGCWTGLRGDVWDQSGSSRSGEAAERPFLPRGRRGAEYAEERPSQPIDLGDANPTPAPTLAPPAHLSARSAPLGP